ncbi:hypothetical protein SAMN05428982_2958 [Pseudoxanthomonas sp. CF385]|uniref:hypothetical protein n=1 Tax=Pseudoxanthomonas sp. CF385 TaxID=1881042 RepID=UPI000880C655|nr:hypothetical protein [Pseudoxanthomonas sp. CF385]SDR02897.1 hypothetical protein SAMN05428982_2958 [Pseudoxanthomonas sp. CF385]
MRKWMLGLLLQAGMVVSVSAQEQAPPPSETGETGTLVVEIKPFTSEQELPAKAVEQLKSGGLEWGVRDGKVVFTMVGKQFIDFPINHMTRYGQQESLPLPAGEYRVTGIGLEMHTSFSVNKVLERGAFFNEDAVVFRIEPGKTTTVSINPVIRKDAIFGSTFYVPTLMASVRDDAGETPAVALNVRGPASIAWPQYTGPLKFVAK